MLQKEKLDRAFTKLKVAAPALLDIIRLFIGDVAVMEAYAVIAAEGL